MLVFKERSLLRRRVLYEVACASQLLFGIDGVRDEDGRTFNNHHLRVALAAHSSALLNSMGSGEHDASSREEERDGVERNDGRFVKSDLHVHVPVPGQEIPFASTQYSKKEGGKFPAPVIPFSRVTGQDWHGEENNPGGEFGGRIITWDAVYDQSCSRLPKIFNDLKTQGIEFVVFATHDVPPSHDHHQRLMEECSREGFICYTATEYRHERDVLMGNRFEYALRCDNGGAHIGVDTHNGFLKTIQHPNALPSDRLDDEYYSNRAASGGPYVTGEEAGTPSPEHDRTTIEIFADWPAEALDKSGTLPDADLAGVLTSALPGYTPKDGTAFALNKWDAALSRGFKIWGVASGDAFAKSGQAVQERRLEAVQAEWNAAVEAQEWDTMERLAEVIRSKPVGAGYIQIWVPKGQQPTAEYLLQQVEKGEFYAAGGHHIGTPAVEVVRAHVSIDGNYTVELASDSHDVTCEAVTNHGRVVALQKDGSTVSASVSAVCGSASPDMFHCAYIRIQCKRPAIENPRYQYDFNYAWMQPYFLPKFQELSQHFAGKRVHEFKANVRNQEQVMRVVHEGIAEAKIWKEQLEEMTMLRTQCDSAERCDRAVIKRAVQASNDNFQWAKWQPSFFEVELGIDRDVDQV